MANINCELTGKEIKIASDYEITMQQNAVTNPTALNQLNRRQLW